VKTTYEIEIEVETCILLIIRVFEFFKFLMIFYLLYNGATS